MLKETYGASCNKYPELRTTELHETFFWRNNVAFLDEHPHAHLTERMFDRYDNGQGLVGFFIGSEGAYI